MFIKDFTSVRRRSRGKLSAHPILNSSQRKKQTYRDIKNIKNPFRLLMLLKDLPERGISVEVTNNILALLDLTEEIFLTWDFFVLSMPLQQ